MGWRSYRLVRWPRSAEVGLSECWLPLSEDRDDTLLVRDTGSVAPAMCLGPSSPSPLSKARFSSTSESRGGLCFPSRMRLFTLLRVELLQQTHISDCYLKNDWFLGYVIMLFQLQKLQCSVKWEDENQLWSGKKEGGGHGLCRGSTRYSCQEWWKPQGISSRAADNTVKIRTRYFPNTGLNCYCHTNLFCNKKVNIHSYCIHFVIYKNYALQKAWKDGTCEQNALYTKSVCWRQQWHQ